jgi:hypothetical protein
MMILTPSRTVLEPLFAVMAGDVSPKQWAAGAPVIGAASVPAEKPNRSFRLTIIRRVGRPALSYERRKNEYTGATEIKKIKTTRTTTAAGPKLKPGSRRRARSISAVVTMETTRG